MGDAIPDRRGALREMRGMTRNHSLFAASGVALLLWWGNLATGQDAPLHEQIDQLLGQQPGAVAGITASDAEFVRRVSLDLAGVPPSAEEVRAFLADETPNKRELLVERLLGSPLYERRMAEFFDVMLMERRGNTHVPQEEWAAYLLQSVRYNKPWNQLAREILIADGGDAAPRAAVRFYLDRGSEPNLLTRDVGRIFFGRDLQCAQCHNHPLIDDYLQADYHGLLAFFTPGFEMKITEGDKETAYYAERAGGDLHYESVFEEGVKHYTGPRAPGGPEMVEPVFLPGEEYTVAQAENVRPVPKHSRRSMLVDAATGGTNRAFNENIANRLWALMMGRGLVHPVDLHHSSNPPSNPALMRLLGERFAAMNFDVKGFLRELALTQTYQRPLDVPADVLARSAAAGAVVAQLESEREAIAAKSEASAVAFNQTIEAWRAAEAALLPVVAEVEAARAKYTESLGKVAEAQKALSDAQAQVDAKQAVATAVSEAAAKAQEAAAKLPDDAELKGAADKFTERTGQLNAEVAALQKVVEERTAALAGPQGELDANRGAVEAAQQKAAPLRDAMRQAEQAVVTNRKEMTADAEALNQHDERLSTMRLLASIKVLEDAAVASAQAINARQGELDAAQAAVAEYGAVVTQHEADLAAAGQAQSAAAEALAAIQQEHSVQSETAKSVAVAYQSAEAARQKLPEDAVLVDAAAKLKTRSEELAAALSEHQKLVDAAAAANQAAVEKTAAAKAALDAAGVEMSRRNQTVATAETALSGARAQAETDRAAVAEAVDSLTKSWSEEFSLAALQPLSPEQMCWSMLKATGVYDRTWAAEAAALETESPLSEEASQDPAALAARERAVEQRTYDKLKGNVAAFVSVYGAGAGQPQTDFFATADQALYAANGGSILSWAAAAGDNVTARVANAADPQQGIQELYLAVLSRMPTADEVSDATNYLASRPDDKPAAAQELVWGLLTSVEFRFNH